MSKRVALAGLAAMMAIAALMFVFRKDTPPLETSLRLQDALATDVEGYARVLAPRPFQFPRDHAAHDDFKLEWWYYTGNLQSADGRRFGYQFTIFRSALAPTGDSNRLDPGPQPSKVTGTNAADGRKDAMGAAQPASPTRDTTGASWSTKQLYFAHFTLTDVDAGRFRSFEQFSRGAAGLAGSSSSPFRVWVEDWSASAASPDTLFPMHIRARAGELEVDLDLRHGKPLVLQGERGFSKKGSEPGQASYYYSYTRLPTSGVVSVAGDSFDVTGSSWMDREWSTSLLSESQVGWDWFSLQLDGGRELMYFRLRAGDGSASYTDGILVQPDGSTVRFDTDRVTLAVTDTWTSPRSGATYPSGWQMQIPELETDLTLTPLLVDQELDVSIQYWEGAVRVEGLLGEGSVAGYGYVEMTGYGDGAGRRRAGGRME